MGRDYPLPWDEPVEESKSHRMKRQKAIIRKHRKIEKRKKLLGSFPELDRFHYFRPQDVRLSIDPTYF